MHKHTNHLIGETSPYLLQHAHNPVNWYPWGEEALTLAKQKNLPILVSIGYAACHWCHVMERESFENEETAAIMNQYFINIKIDREERPDLDHIYMDAVQAITGSGGWPLNVFLTPETKPFYGGTYFPPVHAHNRPSWPDVLKSISTAFTEKRHEIDAQAENLTDHLQKANAFGLQTTGNAAQLFTNEKITEAFTNLMKNADKEWGGFGNAPKFPQTFSIQFLLRFAHYQKIKDRNKNDNDRNNVWKQAQEMALLSLDKMIEGGIYDQAGGGFARYSTDAEWLAPHFEKMLYDNALLVSVISEAYQLTKSERYKEVIEETIDFIEREMMHVSKGFYAALDADSEGVEGKFYVWNIDEVKTLLGDDAALFCKYYDITEKGNWEHVNILRVKVPLKEFAAANNIPVEEVSEKLNRGKQVLFEKRKERIRPLTDDKIILGWNALMNTASSKAFAATGLERYRQLAIDNMQFLIKNLAIKNENGFHHTWKDDQAKHPAFLDDYAYLVEALIHLQEITADVNWLLKAKEITGFVIENFSEPETGFFFYTKQGQADVIIRKKEVYDGAVPSGNAVMAGNLHYLSIVFDNREWEKRSTDILSSLSNTITRYPGSFGKWNCLLIEKLTGTAEIAVVGTGFEEVNKEILSNFIPNRVIMASVAENEYFPLLRAKETKEETLVYVCRNFSCLQPVASVKEAVSLIEAGIQA